MAKTAKTKTKVSTNAAPVTEQVAPPAQDAATEAENITLTLTDIQSLAECVDMACRRGAYQAGEMMAVGTVYDKVTKFLKTAAAQQKERQAETGEK